MNTPCLLAAATFGSIWMLLWGAAAAIPILLHLWNRRKHREVPWAAVRFLVAALQKNARRLRIEQLLLLAVRVLILVLLAAALADPLLTVMPGLAGGGSPRGQTHVVLVFDVSYSMAYRDDSTLRFDRARELARQLVTSCPRGNGFTLVHLGDPPRVVIGSPAFDKQDVLDEIANQQPLHGGADLVATLSRVETLAKAATEDFPRLTNTQVYLFSDLGLTTWEQSKTASCRARLDALAQAASIVLVDVGGSGDDNLGVIGIEQRDPLPTAGSLVEFVASVRNFGTSNRQRETVELVVGDDNVVGRRTVNVGGGSTVLVPFQHRFEAAGDHRLRVRLSRDRLDVDDTRFRCVSVRESLNVLCVNGKHNAARHVALALSPVTSPLTRISTQVVTESVLLETDLSTYDCLFLCNIGRIGQDEADLLSDYVRQGGGVVIFLGDQVQPESYNRYVGPDAPQPLLPVRIGQIVSGDQYRFAPRNYEHPIVAPFRGHERAGLTSTPIWAYFQLLLDTESPHEVALWIESDAGIVTNGALNGRTVVVATAASPASIDRSQEPPIPWNAFSAWPSFPPLVHEMLLYAVGGTNRHRNVAVGDPIGDVLPVSTDASGLTISLDNRIAERVKFVSLDDKLTWSFADTRFSGFYEARYEHAARTPSLHAVNLDTRESELTRLPSNELPPVIQRETVLSDGDQTILASAAGNHPLFRMLLTAVLVLLVADTVLAWLFGRGTA